MAFGIRGQFECQVRRNLLNVATLINALAFLVCFATFQSHRLMTDQAYVFPIFLTGSSIVRTHRTTKSSQKIAPEVLSV